jgi:hypothetical protein
MRIDLANTREECIVILYYRIDLVISYDIGQSYKNN